jgi:hypothetical protein
MDNPIPPEIRFIRHAAKRPTADDLLYKLIIPGMVILEIGSPKESASGVFWGGYDSIGYLVTRTIAFRAKRFGQKRILPFFPREWHSPIFRFFSRQKSRNKSTGIPGR